jgi:hypothetical protein
MKQPSNAAKAAGKTIAKRSGTVLSPILSMATA